MPVDESFWPGPDSDDIDISISIIGTVSHRLLEVYSKYGSRYNWDEPPKDRELYPHYPYFGSMIPVEPCPTEPPKGKKTKGPRKGSAYGRKGKKKY